MKNLLIALATIAALATGLNAATQPAPLELEPLSTTLELMNAPITVEGATNTFTTSIQAVVAIEAGEVTELGNHLIASNEPQTKIAALTVSDSTTVKL